MILSPRSLSRTSPFARVSALVRRRSTQGRQGRMAMATSQPLTNSASNSLLAGSPCPKTEGATNDSFPAGLRVLVVDDDPICLLILDRMLRRCLYQVTTCGRATEALQLLRGNRDSFDLVISDVVMPDMDGFKLLELVGLEMDLPVIMMSANGEVNAVMKGIKHGACDYLLKPVRLEELKNIWQHVVRRKWRVPRQDSIHEDGRFRRGDDGDYAFNDAYEGKQHRKRKDIQDEDEDGDPDNDDCLTTKKPRVVWSVDLHQQFVNAVNQLGIDKAVPKRILELMSVQGLTRENVASHLQKYRLYLKRLSGVGHQPGGLGPAFLGSADSSFGLVGGVGGLSNLRALAGSCQLSPQALMSSLQAGLLGKVGQPNNVVGLGSVNPSLLSQIAALRQQGTNNGALSRSSYGGQSVPGNFEAAAPDMKQLQLSQQLGAFSGYIETGTGEILPLQQHYCQESLANDCSLGVSGHLVGASKHANSNNAPLMQASQQRGGGQLMGGGVNVNLSGGGISGALDVGCWDRSNASGNLASGTACQSSRLLPKEAEPSLVVSCSLPNLYSSLARIAADNTNFHMSSGGSIDISIAGASLLGSTGLDEVGVTRMGGIESSLGGASEMLPQSSNECAPKFTPLSGGALNQQSQKNKITWQGFGLSHKLGQVNSSILSPRYGQALTTSRSVTFSSGQEQGRFLCRGTTLPCNFSMDNGFAKLYTANAFSRSEQTASTSDWKLKEGVMEAKQEPAWLAESLPDDVHNIVLKQV